MVYNCLHGQAPLYLTDVCQPASSRKHGTVFLPTSLHQLFYRLSRDNLKHFYLPNLSHHFKLLSHICVPCPRSYLAYATLISTFYYYHCYYHCYYYYYYYYYYSNVISRRDLRSASQRLRRAFAVAGPSVWNLLPDYVSYPAVSKDTFRKHL